MLFRDDGLKAAVKDIWLWLGETFVAVELDAFIVMPNHVHGILVITELPQGRWQAAPTRLLAPKPLGRYLGAFKMRATRRINELRGTPGVPVWQRNYYEHIVRDDEDLNRIRQYIMDNPANWDRWPRRPPSGPAPNGGRGRSRWAKAPPHRLQSRHPT